MVRKDSENILRVKSSYLDAVVASRDTTILDLNIGGGMCKFAFCIRSGALVPLELSAYFQLKPTGIFAVEKVVHINHCHCKFCCLNTIIVVGNS